MIYIQGVKSFSIIRATSSLPITRRRFNKSVNGLTIGSLMRIFALFVIRKDPSLGLFDCIDSHRVRIASVGLDLAEKKTENFSNLSAADRALQSFWPFDCGQSRARHSLDFNPGGSLKTDRMLFSPDPEEDDDDPYLRWIRLLWSRGLGNLALTSKWTLNVERTNSLG